jgi:hypothetical protein
VAWPTTLTTDADLRRFLFEQGEERLAEGANDTSDLHEGAATVIGNWLEANGSNDRDDISNASDFAPAAAYLVAAWLVGVTDPDQAERYRLEHLRLMKHTRPKLSVEPRDGGRAARVVVVKQGEHTHYTGPPPGSVRGLFPRRRRG